MKKLTKAFARVLPATAAFAAARLTAFAASPATGDDFNLALGIGLAGGAIVLIILALVFTKKKKK